MSFLSLAAVPSSALPLGCGRSAGPSARARLRRRRAAFTLLEILIALAILGMLTALAITKLGGTLDQSSITTTKLFVNDSMKAPLLTYKIHTGDFPTTEQGLQALLTAPAAVADRWQGPYIDTQGSKLPVDPWKHPYQYSYPGTHNKGSYDVWSMGPDGISGNDDDIGNW